MLDNALIVMALEEECAGLSTRMDVLVTGVGKVNAAMALTKRLAAQPPPALVLNIGTAGGLSVAPGIVVNATRFVQRDMEVTALGFERWQTPFEPAGALENGLRIESLPEVMCGTGDSFEVGGVAAPYEIVDMEAYALAKVAAAFNVTFACLKYISDGASETAAADWRAALNACGDTLSEALETIRRRAKPA
ncbi:MAG: 5'-nucleosidase [Caulobacterales bacterium]